MGKLTRESYSFWRVAPRELTFTFGDKIGKKENSVHWVVGVDDSYEWKPLVIYGGLN